MKNDYSENCSKRKEGKKPFPNGMTFPGEVILLGKKCPSVFILTVGALAVTENHKKK